MSEQHWKQKPERGSLFLMRVISAIARHIGRGVGLLFLYPITLYFLLTGAQTRKASKDYFSRVLPGKVSWRDTYRQLYTFATTLLDRIFLFSGRLSEFDVRVEGAQEVLDCLANGKGCLLLGSHLGSFEIMRATGIQNHADDFSLRILMRQDESEKISIMLNEMAPELAEIIIPVEQPDTMLRVKEAIDNGSLVGLLGDRVCGNEKSMQCEFLGGEVEFPMAPAQLALALQVPIFTFYGIYTGANRYSIYFRQLSTVSKVERQDRTAWMQKVTLDYVNELAEYAKKYPYNWFNIYSFWDNQNDNV